jgi:NADPH:quinone reductase-like Zn-dependent oxidoreductase
MIACATCAVCAAVSNGRLGSWSANRTYPLSETPAAMRYLTAGRARGKVVITI